MSEESMVALAVCQLVILATTWGWLRLHSQQISNLRTELEALTEAFRQSAPSIHIRNQESLDRRAAELELEAMLLALHRLDQHARQARTPAKGPPEGYQA